MAMALNASSGDDFRRRGRLKSLAMYAALAVLLTIVIGPLVSLAVAARNQSLRSRLVDHAAPAQLSATRAQVDALVALQIARHVAQLDADPDTSGYSQLLERVDRETARLIAASRGTSFAGDGLALVARVQEIVAATDAALDQAARGDNEGALTTLDESDALVLRMRAAGLDLAAETEQDITELPNEISDLDRVELWVLAATGAAALVGLGVMLRLLILRSRLVERLDAERVRFIGLIESINYGVFEIDRQGVIEYVNPSGARLLGYEAEELTGSHAYRTLHHTQPDGTPIAPADSWLGRAVRERQHATGEESLVQKDGSFLPVEYSVTPIRQGRRFTGAAVVFRDITERLRRQQAQEDFVAMVAHDLRNPLTSIHGFTQWLQRRDESHGVYDEPTREALTEIRAGAERLGTTLRLFEDLARMETGQINLELAPIELTALLVEELVAARRRYPMAHYGHELAENDEASVVTTDADRVRQVVGNLLDNAARHGGEAPNVTLAMSPAASGRVAIRVRDNGPGIPPELRGQIFRRLRGASGAGGLGLGLYISKQIAGQLGGDLTFQTSAAGTEFVFTLPMEGPGGTSSEGNGWGTAPSAFPRHDLPRPGVGSTRS